VLPRGQAGEGWRKAEELFFQGFEAIGRQRSEIQVRNQSEQRLS